MDAWPNVLAVPGNLPGANNGVVFLLDTTNRILSAVSFDQPTGKVAAMPPLDVQRILDNAGGVGAGRRLALVSSIKLLRFALSHPTSQARSFPWIAKHSLSEFCRSPHWFCF